MTNHVPPLTDEQLLRVKEYARRVAAATRFHPLFVETALLNLINDYAPTKGDHHDPQLPPRAPTDDGGPRP